MERTFTGEVIEWRGPAPYLFVAMTPEESEDLKEEARGLIYWGPGRGIWRALAWRLWRCRPVGVRCLSPVRLVSVRSEQSPKSLPV